MANRYPQGKYPNKTAGSFAKSHWSQNTSCSAAKYQPHISLTKLSPEAKQIVLQDLKKNAPEKAKQLKAFAVELVDPDSPPSQLLATFGGEKVVNVSDLSFEAKITATPTHCYRMIVLSRSHLYTLNAL